MISASKAIMSIAAAAKYRKDENIKSIQNQTVNVTVQQHPHTNVSQPAEHRSLQTQPAKLIENVQTKPSPELPIVERDIKLEPELEDQPGLTSSELCSSSLPTVENYYEELENLHDIVNNYETVAKALILIIELLQSNPLKLNKIIVPTEDAFKELIIVLTAADDVEIRYSEDITCGIKSSKYRLIEDIIVIKNQEPKSLKYSYPDIIRLFDRFNISIKMIAKN
jgi:hypothetical protein